MDDSVRSDTELNVLRLLLSGASAVAQPNRAEGNLKALLAQLCDYVWNDQEHRVVYECLRTPRRVHLAPLREELAAAATRLGHPDVDWSSYFEQPPEGVDIADLILSLKRNRF